MQYHSALLNSTLLDGVGLRGQKNATYCAVQTGILEIRDLGRKIIPNFRRKYPLPLLEEMTCCACASVTMLK